MDIRIVKNIVLAVDMGGETQDVLFEYGSIYSTTQIEQDPKGFCNIFFANGTVARGVSNHTFHNYNTPVVDIPAIEVDTEPTKDNEEETQ